MRDRSTTPAVINADLHRERQPAIKVHGFHGESQQHLYFHLFSVSVFLCIFLPLPRTFFLPSRRADARRSLRAFFHSGQPNRLALRSFSVNATWNQLATTSRSSSLPSHLNRPLDGTVLRTSRRIFLPVVPKSPQNFQVILRAAISSIFCRSQIDFSLKAA